MDKCDVCGMTRSPVQLHTTKGGSMICTDDTKCYRDRRGEMRPMNAPSWLRIPGYDNWFVSNRGEIRNGFTHFIPSLFVKNGEIYVELTKQGVYLEVKLADILLDLFPEEQNR